MKRCKSILCVFLCLFALLMLFTGCQEKTDTSPFTYSKGLDANGHWEKLKALDYVTVFDYDAITIPADKHTITDEAVQAEIDKDLAEHAESKNVTDRAVKDGDTVNIDYVGSVGGVPFDGGNTNGQGTEVTIGVTSYIDDFLEQIIGHKPGETFDVNVTFPDPYQNNPDLANKDAVFVTTVNHIVEKPIPELTDAYVAEKLSAEHGWKTVAEMKDSIRADLQKNAIQGFLQEYLTANAKIKKDVPQKLMDYQKGAMLKYYQNAADSYSMSLEDFLSQQAGVASVDELVTSSAEDLKKAAEQTLIIQAIAEDAKITVSDADVAAYFKDQMGTEDYSQYETEYGMPYLKQAVLSYKVITFLEGKVKLG